MNIKKFFSKRRKKGFSLIEMVTVISILAVLALIIVPNLTSYTKKAEFSKYISNARLIERSVGTFYAMNKDFPRLDDTPYTKAQIEAYSENIYNVTGEKITLDPSGKYYDINYDEMSLYLDPPENEDKPKYILQNPVGKVFYLENLTESGENRADFDTPGSGSGEGGGTTNPEDGEETGGENPGGGGETGGGENPGGEENPEDNPGDTSGGKYTQAQIDELVAQGYIKVSTIEDLNNVRNNLSGKYIQINDIDMASTVGTFASIGTQANSFSGVYNGGNYTISNLTMASSQDYKGLFATVTTGAHILNLNMTNVAMNFRNYAGVIVGEAKVSSYGAAGARLENIRVSGGIKGYAFIGGIVGKTNTATLSNVHFDGTITVTSTTGGGIVAHANDATKITGSSFSGTINGSARNGGIAGWLTAGASDGTGSRIENSYSSGTINGVDHMGGIAGMTNKSFISTSYSTANIKGRQYVGGLVGDLYSGAVEDSYTSGTLYGTLYVGGLTGRNSSGKLKNSYSAKTLAAGSAKTAGVYGNDNYGYFYDVYFDKTLDSTATGDKVVLHGKTSVQMKAQSTYNNWDFTNTWKMGPDGYPVLK